MCVTQVTRVAHSEVVAAALRLTSLSCCPLPPQNGKAAANGTVHQVRTRAVVSWLCSLTACAPAV